MKNLKLTSHAEKRINQRGFRISDPEIIRQYGTPIDDPSAEVYLMRNRDVDDRIRDLKKEIARCERLRGCKAVIQGESVVTLMHTGR